MTTATVSREQTTDKLDRSALFTFYNKARACGLDRKRVNRALGLLQANKLRMLSGNRAAAEGSNGATYIVTGRSCTCPDHTWRGQTCKHLVAFWLMIRANEQKATGTGWGERQVA